MNGIDVAAIVIAVLAVIGAMRANRTPPTTERERIFWSNVEAHMIQATQWRRLS
jgi:hypothetical protein